MTDTRLYAHFLWFDGAWQPNMHNATFPREAAYVRSLTYPLDKAHTYDLEDCPLCKELAKILPSLKEV